MYEAVFTPVYLASHLRRTAILHRLTKPFSLQTSDLTKSESILLALCHLLRTAMHTYVH